VQKRHTHNGKLTLARHNPHPGAVSPQKRHDPPLARTLGKGRDDICQSYECADLKPQTTAGAAVHMRNGNNPWVHGHAADPFLALLIAILIGAVLAGTVLLLR
jgi:hypothetical protein